MITVEEYEAQKALGILTIDTISRLAADEDTPTEVLLKLREDRSHQGQNWWFIGWCANLNLDRRGIS